jgi:hypothetical protein
MRVLKKRNKGIVPKAIFLILDVAGTYCVCFAGWVFFPVILMQGRICIAK